MKSSETTVNDFTPDSEAEAFFNVLALVEKVYRETFLPPLRTILQPTAFERILLEHAFRIGNGLEGAVQLESPRFLMLHIGVIRICFEIAVEIELLVRAGEVFPEQSDPEGCVATRLQWMAQLIGLEYFRGLQEHPDPLLTKIGRERFVRHEKETLGDAEKIWKTPNMGGSHWWAKRLIERIKKLDELRGKGTRFQDWHDREYKFASHFVHGGLTPISTLVHNGSGRLQLSGLFFPWLEEFIVPHCLCARLAHEDEKWRWR